MAGEFFVMERLFRLGHEPALTMGNAKLVRLGPVERHATCRNRSVLERPPFELPSLLLRDLAVVSTADSLRRRAFSTVWPAVMDTVLDAVARGRDVRDDEYGGARAFAGLVPRPIPTGQEVDVEGTVRAAANGWPTIAALEQPIERWLPLAEGSAEAVDALVGFLETAPLAEQVERLPWVTRIVSAGFAEIANRSYYLPFWLERLRASGLLEASRLGEYQRMVDGLAAAGDSRALRLQRALEQ